MDLTLYVRVLRRRWGLLALTVFACLVGAAAAAWLQTPIYQTSTVLVAQALPAGGTSADQPGAAARAGNLAQFATTAPVEQAAVTEAAGRSGLPPRAPDQITAAADGVSPFITVTVSDSDPRWARAVANAYLTAMPTALEPIDPVVATDAHRLAVVTEAPLPSSPSAPDKRLYLLLGGLLGVVLGIGLMVFWEALDQQIHDPEDVARALELPILGAIPQRGTRSLLPILTEPHSPRAEAYRAVQANLVAGDAAEPPRCLVVTSPSSREGVTTLAANVAVALAGSGRRVLLVDANLRTPRLHEIFGLPVTPGLAEVLTGQATLAETIRPVPGSPLRVLPAGRPPTDPVERLTGVRTAVVLEELQREGDIVVVDAPPVVPVADALFLAVHATAVLLVARAGSTKRKRLTQARDAMARVHVPLLGIVINGVAERHESVGPRRRGAHAPDPGDAQPAATAVEGGKVAVQQRILRTD